MLRAASPLRVLVVTDTYPPDVNGAAYFTHRLAEGLAGRGHHVHVLCPSAQGPPHVAVAGGVTEHRVPSARIPFQPTMRAALPLGLRGHVDRLLARLAPDVVHVQSHFTVSRTALVRARSAGIPTVLTNHFMPDNLYAHARVPRSFQSVAGSLAWHDMVRVAEQADHVTTPTPRAARLLREQGLSREAEAVSCGIDLDRFFPRASERSAARARLGVPDRDSIVFVGRMDEEKRVDELVRALALLTTDLDAQLVLAGTGQREEELSDLARVMGLGERVRFLGFVPDELLPLVYVAGDVFAIAGVAELQSIATLEAMSTGLPVVAADAMALPHLVAESHNGYLFPSGEVEVLADRLRAVLSSRAERGFLGAAGREMAAEHDHRRSLERFESLYACLSGTVAVPDASGTRARGDRYTRIIQG